MLILTAFICSYSIHVQAKEEVLASITNDENDEVYAFIASSDDTNQNLKTFFRDNYINGKKVSRELLPSDGLTKDGVILEKRKDQTVISLKSDNFNNAYGGSVTIDTLYNGITGEHKQYEIELARDGEKWKLFKNNNPISKIHIEVNKKILIGAIGVKEVHME